METIPKRIVETSLRYANSIALESDAESLTYKDLTDASNRLARLLLFRGLVPGSTVGIVGTPGIDPIVGLLAILMSGCAFVPVDERFPLERMKSIFRDSGCQAVLAPANLVDAAAGFDTQIIPNDAWRREPAAAMSALPEGSADQLAYIMYTSGSTGRPKGVMIEHGTLLNFFDNFSQRLPFSSDQSILSLASFSFDIFLVEILLPLTIGMRVVIPSADQRKSPRGLGAFIEKSRIDIMQVTPSRLQWFLYDRYDGEGIRQLSCLLIGGEQLNPSLVRKIRPLTGASLYNLYGPTEATIWSSVKDLSGTGPVTIGSPFTHASFHLFDEFGHPCSPGNPGILYIGGTGLARGYVGDPKLSSERFVHHRLLNERIYNTGDLARQTSDGEYEILGRVDHVVKIRGYRVGLEEVETALSSHPLVSQAVAAVRTDADGLQSLHAYVMRQPDCSVPWSTIRQYISGMLPDYMIPSSCTIVDEIPLTSSGKADRQRLIADSLSKPVEAAALPTPNTDSNSMINIVCSKLSSYVQGDVWNSLDTDLTDLGVNSIQFIQFIVELEMELGIVFEEDDLLFENFSTVREIVKYIQQSR